MRADLLHLRLVGAFAYRVNNHRPHDALAGKTRAAYLKQLSAADQTQSHMA